MQSVHKGFPDRQLPLFEGLQLAVAGARALDEPKTHKICDKKNFFVTKFDFLVKF